MARFLLTPFGSGGDVNPHLWLGKLLLERGHEVKMITVPMFRDMAEGAGLAFIGVGREEDFMDILHDPDLWRPLAGTKLVFRHALKALPGYLEAVSRELEAGPAVLVSPFHQFAARIAREKFRVPLVTVHLQPACFLSAWDVPVFFPWMARLRVLPAWLRQCLLTIGNPVNRQLRRALKELCATAGVTPPRWPVPDWLHSPDGNLALFPHWFGAPQPDWPPDTVAAGFPLEDLRGQFAMPGEIDEFLARGDKPVLFSPGTGHAQSRSFFQTALDACEMLGCRALLGTRFPDQLPAKLPAWARAFEYLPFSEIVPRSAALVHHGGIGTMSQALAAGVPQLVMPMAHDQPDNAARLKRLGAGDWLAPRRFTVENVARALRRIMSSADVKAACERAARRCREDHAAEIVVEKLERVAGKLLSD